MQLFEPNAVLTDNIMGYLWGKLGYGALLFATALTNASICEGSDRASRGRSCGRWRGEAVAVATKLKAQAWASTATTPRLRPRRAGRRADASFDAMVAHNAKSAKTHSGIWRDLAVRKRRTEADAQLGPIVASASRSAFPRRSPA